MKLYRHYKNKLYRYRGEALHSESLEPIVIYEALYENELGKTWVRPKSMFFESIEIDGSPRPRFEPLPVRFQITRQISERDLATVASLVKVTLGSGDLEAAHAKLKMHPNPLLLIASVDGEAAGFKLGYEKSPGVFYSWLGGVRPEYRKAGLGSELMARQHDRCREIGYRAVQTKTLPENRAMLILNLKAGFVIQGIDASRPDRPKVVLEKNLI